MVAIKERNPQLDNLYPELGSAFNLLSVAHPEMCMHLMGRNIKHFGSDHVLWGTDCLWWGASQWCIDAMKRFQITDEMCEGWDYEKITDQDRANILGLNAARLYGVDVNARRNDLPPDVLDRLRVGYLESDGPTKFRSNAVHGWVFDDTALA
jgi:hypothetical protein